METIYSVVSYLFCFLTNPSFQRKQRWVEIVAKRASIIHEHAWTGVRFIWGPLVFWVDLNFGPELALAVFLLGALTDWFDGLVAWSKKKGETFWGSFLDGVADKFYVIPIMWFWGVRFSSPYVFIALAFIEGGGYILIKILDCFGIIKKDKQELYSHLLVGKIKFGTQISLVCIIWIARNLNPEWEWWPLWINLILGVVILLAAFSVACKIKKESIRFLADFITLGNVVCGTVAIFIGNIKMAAVLIIVAAIFDIADGYVARKTKKFDSKFGDWADFFGDFVSFSLATGWILLRTGVSPAIAAAYVLGTLARLINFEIWPGVPGVFKGVPSTAAAIFLASLLLWDNPPLEFLPAATLICVGLEMLFIFKMNFLKWYHFRRFPDFPKSIIFGVSVLFILVICFWGIGESISVISFLYLIFFSKPIADWLWEK